MSNARELAHKWVTNNEDPEVRRMYGHYVRAFMAGFEQSEAQKIEQGKLTEQDYLGSDKQENPDYSLMVGAIIEAIGLFDRDEIVTGNFAAFSAIRRLKEALPSTPKKDN